MEKVRKFTTPNYTKNRNFNGRSYHAPGSRQGPPSTATRHENSQQQSQQQFIRSAVYSQPHLRQPAGYPPGTGLPPTGLVHDIKSPFPQQQGLAVSAPGQQAATSPMVYSGQHVPNRPQLNTGATTAPMQQTHGGQQYFTRSGSGGGSGSGAAGAGGGQGGNQGQPRHVQQGQRTAGMNMPLPMMSAQQTGGATNNQQNFYGPPPAQMYLPTHMGQPHIIYSQHSHQHHHTTLTGPVEFSNHPEALSVSMIPPHSSQPRYIHSQENGDMPSTAMSTRLPYQQYQSQPTTTMYVSQPQPQYGMGPYVYPQMMNMHTANNRPGVPGPACMVAPVTNPQPQAPPPKRQKNLIRIQDPTSLLDVTDDVLSNAGNNPTPPASGASSARGTPPSNVATPPPDHGSDIPAMFARQVAAVVSGNVPVQPPSPQLLAASAPPQSSPALVAPSSVTPSIAPTSHTTTPVTVPSTSRTKSEKEFNGNQLHANVSAVSDRSLNNVNVVNTDTQENSSINAIVTKEPKVASRIEVEVPPPVVVKAVEKAEPAQLPHLPAAAHPTPAVNVASSARPVTDVREAVAAPPPPMKKQDSAAPPPPFPTAKNANPSEVNASVAPFGALNPSLISATDKMSGTPPGSSQVIISAPPDHPPTRELAVIEHGPTHLHSQVVVPPTKIAPPVVPAPFTQQPGPGQQPIAARQSPAVQVVDSGRLSGHHHPPVTPSPFGQAQQQPPPIPQPQPLLVHKQQNGEVQPELTKTSSGETEGPAKDGKLQHLPPSTAASHIAKKNRDVKSKSEPKEISNTTEVVVEEKNVALANTTTVPEIPEVVISVDAPAENEEISVTSSMNDEGKATEEMLDKEAKRKVAEKNEENSKVSSMALEKVEKDAQVISDQVPSKLLPNSLKFSYKEDQWSPTNLEGKKQYDRDFLLKMQNQPPSLKKPEGLPDLEVIRDDIVNTVILDRMPSTNVNKHRGGQVAYDFVPNFVPNNKTQSRGRGSQQGRKDQPQQPPKKVLSISLCQDVKLRDAENPWVPSYKQSKREEEDGIEKLNRKMRALLNKLTPQNFASLMGQANTFGIDTEEKLIGVINLVFEKAIDEPNFSVAYANMCKSLSSLKVQSANSEGVNFRKLIISRCQTEFEKDANEETQQREERQRMIDEADAEKKKCLQEELQEGVMKSRRRSLGNIRFIGELYKLKMLTGKIMHDCVKKLLKENDEDSLECLCRLLTTIGKDLEFPPQPQVVNKPNQGPAKPLQADNRVADYFQSMQMIVNKRQTTSRVRFMLLDVIDLRLHQWVPRRDENNPKTIDQIHREAEAEHQEKQLMYQTPIGKRNDDRMDGRRGPAMSGKRGSNENEGGWTNVGGGGRKTPMAPMPDTSKCRMRMENLDENNIQLGPQTSGWSKGSKGGGSSQEGDRTPASQGMNRYLLLSNDHPQMDSRRSTPRQMQSHSLSGRDGRNMGGSMSQQLPISNYRSSSSSGGGGGGGYKGSSISREHEQAIANVKNLTNNNDGSGRPPSLSTLNKPPPSASSRSSSASRESERESLAKECPIEQLETKIKSTIEEFLTVGDIKEAVLSVTEDVPFNKMPYFVTFIINQFLEKSSKARMQIGQLLCELVKAKKLTVDQFWTGMNEIFESAEELAIDIPKFWEYLSEIISPLFVNKLLSLGSIKQLAEPLLGPNQTRNLLANILKVINNTSPAEVHNLWRESGLRISNFVPANEVDEFVSRHKLQFLQEEVRSVIPFISKEKVIDGLIQELQTNIVENQHANLTKGLDKIFNWINDHVSEQQQKDPSFIRALVTAIVDRSIIIKEPGSYEINETVFDLCCTVIKRYVDNQDSLELETLFALQSFVHRLEHPKGLLNNFFRLLFEKEVISDDGFLAWKSSEGQEVEGHAVAVKAVNSFLLSLKQSEEEDEST